ncbi:MAG: Uncharacterised protein [Cellulomonadaceae bacterium TMED98]|nr:MAG: Uncharacterised protein [Cellulomonadaceae bacterium TMED98]
MARGHHHSGIHTEVAHRKGHDRGRGVLVEKNRVDAEPLENLCGIPSKDIRLMPGVEPHDDRGCLGL